jgi:SAM-dependent methyltransferase
LAQAAYWLGLSRGERLTEDLRARLYDWECAQVLGRTDQDVRFWLEVARARPGPCLELACGTGRVAAPLAAAGVDVVGLDINPAMLAMASRRQSGALFVVSDMRRFALHRRFGAVLIPYNSIQLLTNPADQTECLAASAAHLADGGVVGLEVTDFQAGATQTLVADEVLHVGSFGGEQLTLVGSLAHDLDTRVSHYRRRFMSSSWTVEDEVAIRSLDKTELADLLVASDLTPRGWWEEGSVTRVVAASSAALSSSRCGDGH